MKNFEEVRNAALGVLLYMIISKSLELFKEKIIEPNVKSTDSQSRKKTIMCCELLVIVLLASILFKFR